MTDAAIRLCLHQLCALDVPPIELIGIAAGLGCSAVTIFTHVPDAARGRFPLVTQADLPLLQPALAEAGVSVCNLEVFPLDRDDAPDRFDAALALGAALGAARATAHVHDADFAAAVRRFGDFCDRAAAYGLIAGLEFNGFSAVWDLPAALAIVEAAGRANGEIVLDMLHLVRSDGTAADVERAQGRIGYAQICDGPLLMAEEGRWREAIRERMLPGAGEFPLAAIVGALAPGSWIDVEVPQTAAMKAGVSALDRARAAVEASSRVLETIA